MEVRRANAKTARFLLRCATLIDCDLGHSSQSGRGDLVYSSVSTNLMQAQNRPESRGQAITRGRVPFHVVCALVVVAWLAAVGTGFGMLWRYKSIPGADAVHPARWPAGSAVGRDAGRATLVLFAHPMCPCTRASLSELARLLPVLGDRVSARVVVVRTPDAPSEWDESDLWSRAAEIPGVVVIRDEQAAEAERFRALTSGMTLLYDAAGSLRFAGGITASRGHEGDSFGRRRIVSIVKTGTADRDTSPVFGCALDHRVKGMPTGDREVRQ